MIVLLIIVIHEFGHFFISYLFKWNISSINIYPFGGLIIYNDKIDKSLKEELLVTIAGPINQCLLYLLIYILNNNLIISNYIYTIFKNYHYSILLFNLLPIIPLDGSKILNVILNKVFDFRLSYVFLLIISVIFTLVFIISFNNKSYILIIMFIIYKAYIYIKERKIIYSRFILEKYLYKNKYKKYLFINNIKKMKRNKRHIINNYQSEKMAIKKEFYS